MLFILWYKNMRQWITLLVMKRVRVIMSSGLTPQKLVLTLCIGAALGTMPLLWGTTLICIILAHLFSLNHVALQSVNYLLYPVQLVLLMPFLKLGERLFPWGPKIPPDIFSTLVHNPELSSLYLLVWMIFKSLTAWLITVIPLALLVYGLLTFVAVRNKAQTSRPL